MIDDQKMLLYMDVPDEHDELDMVDKDFHDQLIEDELHRLVDYSLLVLKHENVHEMLLDDLLELYSYPKHIRFKQFGNKSNLLHHN
jgi:hypothetical protein